MTDNLQHELLDQVELVAEEMVVEENQTLHTQHLQVRLNLEQLTLVVELEEQVIINLLELVAPV